MKDIDVNDQDCNPGDTDSDNTQTGLRRERPEAGLKRERPEAGLKKAETTGCNSFMQMRTAKLWGIVPVYKRGSRNLQGRGNVQIRPQGTVVSGCS